MEGIESATSQKLDFMTLLVTEMQNQNPLEPMNQQQMAAQLAQFSQLEKTEEMNETMKQLNSSFAGAMVMAEYEYAKTMLDRNVSFYSDYWGQSITGRVARVDFDQGNPVLAVQAVMEKRLVPPRHRPGIIGSAYSKGGISNLEAHTLIDQQVYFRGSEYRFDSGNSSEILVVSEHRIAAELGSSLNNHR